MHPRLRRLPNKQLWQAEPQVLPPSAADIARDTGLHCVSLPLHNIADDRRYSFPAGAWMQATLMALFSLCRRLCARLQVGFGCRHWLMTFQIKCHCKITLCLRGQAHDLAKRIISTTEVCKQASPAHDSVAAGQHGIPSRFQTF